MTKKSAAGVDNDVGILEADDDFPDGDDFVNYSFEEPLELKLNSDVDVFGDWNGDNAWGTTAVAGPNKQGQARFQLRVAQRSVIRRDQRMDVFEPLLNRLLVDAEQFITFFHGGLATSVIRHVAAPVRKTQIERKGLTTQVAITLPGVWQ